MVTFTEETLSEKVHFLRSVYSNIPHDKGLIALRKYFESREDKVVSTDFLMDLAGCVLKKNVFEHKLFFYSN